MSVINTMLKDLDRRGVEYTSSDDAILSGLEPNRTEDQPTRNSSPVLISVASVFMVVAILVVGYYISPYQLVPHNVQQNSAAINDQPVVEQPAANTEQKAVVVQAQPVTTEQKPVEHTSAVTTAPAEATTSAPAPTKTTPTVAVVAQHKAVKPKQQSAVQPEAAVDNEPVDTTEEHVSKKQREFSAQEKSQQAYAEALTLYNQGSRQSAKSSLQQALDHYAANKEARALLAAIYLEDNKPEIASELIVAGLSLQANDQQLLRLYLEAQVQSGNYSEAINVMEQRLRLTQPEDYGYLAGLYQKNNDHINAVKMYARALQLRPSNSIWWMGQGISLEMMQQYDEAIRSYQQSISTGRLSGKLAKYATSRINSIKQLNDDSVS